MRLYIAGKITGDEKYLDKFSMAQIRLEQAGHQVINPAMMCGVMPNADWGQYLYAAVEALFDLSDGLVLLPDWKDSKGACLEYGFFLGSELPVYLYTPEGNSPIRLSGPGKLLRDWEELKEEA